MAYVIVGGREIIETDQRVGDGRAAFVSVFKARAERWARMRNAEIELPSYRYEVVPEGRRWAVVAMQNVAMPK